MPSERIGIEWNASGPICADSVNILGKNINAINKYTKKLLKASREVDLEVNRKWSTWLCLITTMQDKIIIYLLLINPVKMD
jgi:hypothetical protein